MSNNVVTELAPTGTLRAAINLANFLLVSSRADNGAPQGGAGSRGGDRGQFGRGYFVRTV